MKVKFMKWDCEATFARYQSDNSPAVCLVDEVTREPVAVATVHIADAPLRTNCVFVKDYSENTGMAEALVEGGVIEETVMSEFQSGFVSIKSYRLTEAALKLLPAEEVAA
jgi:hypothetical protein